MVPLKKITDFLDKELKLHEFEDYAGARNGLQIENSGKVTRIVAAVDSCEATMVAAVAAEADLLIVHHGLFWNAPVPVTGPVYRKMKCALDADLAVYSVHLPLDAHPKFGNNVLLAHALGFTKNLSPFGENHGRKIGVALEADVPLKELQSRLTTATGQPAILAGKGPSRCRRIGIISGGAGSDIYQAAAAGLDTYITGEASHGDYLAAEELGLNLLLGGHYATETFGIKALAHFVAKKFRLPRTFIDHPTPL